MNYTELIASIQTYTQNSEATFVAELPTFVKQAEDRIYHMVQLPALRRSQEGVSDARRGRCATGKAAHHLDPVRQSRP